MTRHASLIFVVAALGGCTTTVLPTNVDANLPDAHVRPQRVLLPSELYGPCVSDEQCPGAGAVCRRNLDGYPMGFCTVPCTDRSACEDRYGQQNHYCVRAPGATESFCEASCENGIECRDASYTCFGADSESNVRGVCRPVCGSDADCGEGAVCNPYTARCMATGTAIDGERTGGPCESGTDCASGSCVAQIQDGTPSAFTNGTCVANCVLPEGYTSTAFYTGEALPAAGCGDDNVCLPFNGSFARRDSGVCFAGCSEDGDCREYYFCRKSFTLGSRTFSYTNGVCWPRDCRMAGCPSGQRCVAVPNGDGTSSNACAPG